MTYRNFIKGGARIFSGCLIAGILAAPVPESWCRLPTGDETKLPRYHPHYVYFPCYEHGNKMPKFILCYDNDWQYPTEPVRILEATTDGFYKIITVSASRCSECHRPEETKKLPERLRKKLDLNERTDDLQ